VAIAQKVPIAILSFAIVAGVHRFFSYRGILTFAERSYVLLAGLEATNVLDEGVSMQPQR